MEVQMQSNTSLRSLLRWVLRGTTDDRLRATWRLLLATVLTIGGGLVGVLAIQRASIPAVFEPVVGHALAAIAVLVTIGVLARYVDRRHVSDYGFSLSQRWAVDAIAGTGLGILLVGIAFGVASQRGTITIVGTLSSGALDSFALGVGVVIVGWVLVGFWEETLFRGVFITNAAEGLAARGLPPSLALAGAWASSSAVYGAFHGPLGSQPDGSGPVYALAMTAVMGGLFGLAYVFSGELAFPIGLHIGINFAEGTLFFGAPDGITASLLRVERTATASAVQFQSLEPIVILPTFLLGYVAVAGWFYRRGQRLSSAVLSDSSNTRRPTSRHR